MSEVIGWRGRFYEDFEVGDEYPHPLGRTITDVDNIWFTNLTMNTNPVHFDAVVAGKTEFGKLLVNSCFTLSLVVGLSVTDLSQNVIANLQWTDVKLPHPVFAGDTIYARSRVLEKRESSSRPHAGIVSVSTDGFNQDGVIVISFFRTFLVYKREAGIANRTPPRPKEPSA
ncbi:MAG: MaoC family dehydratase [Candidatus Eremiobacteraeota bacterium]|jgi:acyl dehydratase|nr:MaoC family dehydratase [Candidatus Eremiobacteraeota bacterium]